MKYINGFTKNMVSPMRRKMFSGIVEEIGKITKIEYGKTVLWKDINDPNIGKSLHTIEYNDDKSNKNEIDDIEGCEFEIEGKVVLEGNICTIN